MHSNEGMSAGFPSSYDSITYVHNYVLFGAGIEGPVSQETNPNIQTMDFT